METHLGTALSAVRTDRGLSLREVASLLGIPHTTVWNIERGRYEPRLDTLRKLVALYRLNVNLAEDGEFYTWS